MAEFSAGASDDVRIHHADLIDDHVVTICPILHLLRNLYVFFVPSALLLAKRDSCGAVYCGPIYF